MYKQLMLSGILFSVWCVKASSESEVRTKWAPKLGTDINNYKKAQRALLRASFQVKSKELNIKAFEESTSKDEYLQRFNADLDPVTREFRAGGDNITRQIVKLRQELKELSTVESCENFNRTIGEYIRPVQADLYALRLRLENPHKPSPEVQAQKDFNFRPIRFTSEL